jgi:hypothetical protein
MRAMNVRVTSVPSEGIGTRKYKKLKKGGGKKRGEGKGEKNKETKKRRIRSVDDR